MNQPNSHTEAAVIDPAVSEHDLMVEVSVRIWGRDEELVNIKPRIVYPLGLHPSISSVTSGNVAQFFQMLVLQPVNVMLNLREQVAYAAATRLTGARIKPGADLRSATTSAPGPSLGYCTSQEEFDDLQRLTPDFVDPRARPATLSGCPRDSKCGPGLPPPAFVPFPAVKSPRMKAKALQQTNPASNPLAEAASSPVEATDEAAMQQQAA